MAYNPATQRKNTTFGGATTDGNRIGLTGFPNVMLTQDATGTPVTSPATVNTTQTLVVPPNAVSITLTAVTNAVQVSEDSTQTAYFSLPAATTMTFPCARLTNIYLKTASSTVVSFFFNCF
jgi:hypothetical protein